jgi:asparagine synthase (glutamine-hydrolysing)
MSAEALHRVGVFSEPAVAEMVRRCRESAGAPGADSQAFMGVLSTQLWHEQFIQNAMFIAPLPVSGASVLLSDGSPLVSTR